MTAPTETVRDDSSQTEHNANDVRLLAQQRPAFRGSLLLVSFDFPPVRTSAVYRVRALSKYLFRLGWKVTILTRQTRQDDIQDPALLEDFPPQVRIVRTPYVAVSGWETPVLPTMRSLGVLLPEYHRPSRLSRFDAAIRSLATLVRSCLYFPDATAGWIPFAFLEAVRLHMEHPFDAVYTTSPPRSANVVGHALRRLFGLPWILEYMDPWYSTQRPWRKRFECRLQATQLAHADAVVTVTQNHAKELRRDFHLPDDRVTVISNGYDEDDFRRHPQLRPSKELPAGFLHLTHVGTIYPGFGGCFFHALEDLVGEQPRLKEQVRVNIIGFPDDAVQRHAQNGLLRDVVRIHGYMPHREALQAIQASHALLLFLGDPDFSRLAVSSKIYEYLRVGCPILAVAYSGGVQELVERGHAGWVVRPDDLPGMKHALKELLRADSAPKGTHTPPDGGEFVAQFRYDRLAGRLADVLNGVAHGRRA